jgi:hypothetical protein
VNSSRLLSLGALGLALAITVPPKLRDFSVVQQTLRDNLEKASAGLLARDGFEFKSREPLPWSFVIDAQRNDCQLQIQELATEGFNADAIKIKAPEDAQFVFEYRGKLWMSDPAFRATITELWNRLKWRFGVDSSWSPVISITAVGPCAIKSMSWEDVASIQAN